MKIHYTFDREAQVKCLARWPHVIQIRAVPVDESSIIGVIDLRTCLQAVTQCSPELASSSDQDYAVYAFDYSEADTPMVGQGMLSWALGYDQASPPSQFLTGRVTQNKLAIFANGIQETLEVKLKLTPVPRVTRPTHVAPQHNTGAPRAYLQRSASNVSEYTGWNQASQLNPDPGHHMHHHMAVNSSPALAPCQPYNSGYEPRHEPVPQNYQNIASRPGSRTGSVEPNVRHVAATPPLQPIVPAAPGMMMVQGPPPSRPVAPKPRSRASSKAPTGRPRGRPRKKALPVEGSTSGYEDGTDADDGPVPKKRAKTTQVERSNTATFGSASESLRVTASTAGSLRNFRPVGAGGEPPAGSHLQEIPRAPTPVPDRRAMGFPQPRSMPPSNLGKQATSGQEQDGVSTAPVLDPKRSMSQPQDARSPGDSVAPSPVHAYSDGPSPADIGSSPPVPRSRLYSPHSTLPPSSPILPPMPVPQPDSGFMSGGLDDSRLDEEDAAKKTTQAPPAPAVVKPKPKPKRSRAKKKQPPKEDRPEVPPKEDRLEIQTETPGPPELLPTTSIYNPPHPIRNVETPKAPASSEQPVQPRPEKKDEAPGASVQPASSPAVSAPGPQPVPSEPARTQLSAPAEQPVMDSNQPCQATQKTSPVENFMELPQQSIEQPDISTTEQLQTSQSTGAPPVDATSREFADFEGLFLSDMEVSGNAFLDTMDMNFPNFSLDQGSQTPTESQQYRVEREETEMEFVLVPGSAEEAAEPELPPPMVPASDPVVPQSQQTQIRELAHPQTDAAEPSEGRFNKNFVKKQAIKQKLEEAIARGQMPQYCSNCGAIQTPTWRKIWTQKQHGLPAYHEYSEKPGHVTAINILHRDAQGKPILYELVKKALGPDEDKTAWTEVLLCNPCGIWFSKWKSQRPEEKWNKDSDRLTQVRKKRTNGSQGASRAKKSRTKSDPPANLTSEAYLPTDPTGPVEDEARSSVPAPRTEDDRGKNASDPKRPGSTHSTQSRGSGTPGSPIALDDDLGITRRVLFPSPRKEGEHRALGEVNGNLKQTPSDARLGKKRESAAEKENSTDGPGEEDEGDDDMAELFGVSPRPSTPPPRPGNGSIFKTPTRQTPSHRPVTRSVTKSIRTSKSVQSPSQAQWMNQQTPSRTPRSHPSSGGVRRGAPWAAGASGRSLEDSPITKSISQLLSEANEFMGPASQQSYDMDMDHLTSMDIHGHLAPGGHLDFSTMLSNDAAIGSSSPAKPNAASSSRVQYFVPMDPSVDIWKHLNEAGTKTATAEEDWESMEVPIK